MIIGWFCIRSLEKVEGLHAQKVANESCKLEYKLDGVEGNKVAISNYLREKFTALWRARQLLLENEKMNLERYNLIYEKARAASQELYHYLRQR